jgi:thiol-disulfide isomerase/thioredoxin
MNRRFFTRAIVLLAVLTLPFGRMHAQAGKLPPFRMMQASGKLYKAENLPMGKPILIIYFSPDCEHCQKFMKNFFQKTNDFKKASVVMITYLPVEKLAQFDKDFSVQKFSNLYTGTEGTSFFVRNYYNIMQMPFTALYDKNGNFIASYSRDIPLNDLSKKLNSLN